MVQNRAESCRIVLDRCAHQSSHFQLLKVQKYIEIFRHHCTEQWSTFALDWFARAHRQQPFLQRLNQ